MPCRDLISFIISCVDKASPGSPLAVLTDWPHLAPPVCLVHGFTGLVYRWVLLTNPFEWALELPQNICHWAWRAVKIHLGHIDPHWQQQCRYSQGHVQKQQVSYESIFLVEGGAMECSVRHADHFEFCLDRICDPMSTGYNQQSIYHETTMSWIVSYCWRTCLF